jgi:N-acetylmuramoyl-L-alanine amidase-like protein
VRRIAGGLLAFFVLTGTLLVLPVYAAPLPEAEPVAPSIDSVQLGSVDQPQDAAVVTADGEVVEAGPQADVDPPAGAPPTGDPSGTPVDPSDDGDAVASSGDELDGVPALTVSRPHTDHFSSVGVTWAEDDGVTDVSVQLRTSSKAGTWSDWMTIAQDDVDLTGPGGVEAPEVRGGTSPYWTDDAYGVEIIVQAADGTTPRDVQVSLIDPGTSDADAAPGAPEITDQAHAAATMPAIYSRAQWGADESLMGWDVEYAPTIKAATIHHTADGNTYGADDVPRIMRSIYAYHAVSLGWGDIGYNVIVDKFGRAWEGRTGGLASTVVGAHAGGFNYGTFGISMLGNYDVIDTPQVMLDTVANVIAWKLSLFGVDPRGKTTLTSRGGGTSKYPAGANVTLPTVFAHRDVGATACPGRYAYSRMDQIRGMVATRMDALYAAGATTPTDPLAPTAPGSGQVLLRNDNNGGTADWVTKRGNWGDVPLDCDWDGTGTETIGVFRAGRFTLYDSNATAAAPVAAFSFGDAGDTPICGDWDGDGKDTVGVWRKGWFYLRNSNTTGTADGAFPYGNANAQPLAGNWDGDPYDTVAVYQDGVFYYANSNLRPVASGQVPFGNPTDRAVAGDWTARGRDSVGVYRAGTFYLNNSLSRTADLTVRFGDAADRPLVGDWDGNRSTTVGITRGY